MIKLTAFYPFSNFLRVTQEFYEDKAVIKRKSLSSEGEFEFQYKEVGEISDTFVAQTDQQVFSFFLIYLSGFILFIFSSWLHNDIILLRVAQTIFVLELVLYATSFMRSWYVSISDKNDNTLTTIKSTRYNSKMISEIKEKIKANSNNIQEITTSDPFPSQKALFELNYFKFSYLERTTDKFYENGIIGIEKNIIGETAYKIRYDILNGNIIKWKTGNDLWKFIIPLSLLIQGIVLGLRFGFNVNFFIPVGYIVYSLVPIFVITMLFGYVKREIFAFYNKNGKVAYWAYVNKDEKEKVEKIIEYIKSRIPEENKE